VRLDDGTVRCVEPFRMPAWDPGFHDVAEVGVGRDFVCARLTSGLVQCVGANGYGQLGTSDADAGAAPVQVADVANAASLSSGARHSCVRLVGGEVRCWGYNASGAIAVGGAMSYARPQALPWLANVVEVEVSDVTCGRLADGTVRCQGDNLLGALGNGMIGAGQATSVVVGVRNAAQVEGGENHLCALLDGGAVACWGYNSYGCMGNGTRADGQPTPVSPTGLSGVVQVATGIHHSCALLRDGTVRSWGVNTSAQLGDGVRLPDGGLPEVSTVPVTVAGIANAAEVAAGGYFQCARLRDGTVWCWGSGRGAPGRVAF
jgi:alpha-tubulin suppressor-like RCC1 family protein